MAIVNASSSIIIQPSSYFSKVASFSTPSSLPSFSSRISPAFLDNGVSISNFDKMGVLECSYACNANNSQVIQICSCEDNEGDEVEESDESRNETMLYSFSPLPLMVFAALPGASSVRSLFGPIVELVKSFDLPGWLVHWGHPGNMAVVLFAMGGYGTYLGFRIRFSDDVEEKANAKDLHPKLLGGMFFFFALGATGGVISLLTSDKPIFESPHAVTGFIGLALLTLQTLLPTLFEGNPGLRNVHGILGSGIMTLFLVHAALGLQLGLSY